jgi:outer membrane biosynthesis protein TonB
MKVVPLANGGGTIPLRTSKNPVLAVYRHHCGAIASVHQPQGRKANLRYLHCDACGCDQAGGKDYQAKIRENSFESIEALELSENTPTVTEPLLTENLPVTNELPTPLETAPVVVDTVTEPLTPTPEKQTPTPTHKPTDKPTYKVKGDSVKTGLSILLGGLFGGMLSILL